MSQPKKKTNLSRRSYVKSVGRKTPSSKKAFLLFAVAFAVVGGAYIALTHAATDPVTDVAQSNELGYQAAKAAYEKSTGKPLPSVPPLPPKPAGLDAPRKHIDPPQPKPGTPKPAGQPTFPDLNNVKLPPTSSSGLFPKAYAAESGSPEKRLYAVLYAQQFIGWRGEHFYYYNLFKDVNGNDEEWCADFVGYVYNLANMPFWWGRDGWHEQQVATIIQYVKGANAFRDKTYVPVTGDLVFFDWPKTQLTTDHIGLVEFVDAKGGIHTIEGNVDAPGQTSTYPSQRSVQRKVWQHGSSVITSYGHW